MLRNGLTAVVVRLAEWGWRQSTQGLSAVLRLTRAFLHRDRAQDAEQPPPRPQRQEAPEPMKDNVDYWIERHRKHHNELVSVGTIGLSEAENITLYANKKRQTVDVLRELDLIDLQGRAILDVGCGIGIISELFYALGAQVHGVDGSPEAVELAGLRAPGGQFAALPLTDFDPEGSFDVIYCADVLYHLVSDEAWRLTLQRIGRRLKPGGRFILLDVFREEVETPAPHVRFRTRQMYIDALSEVGLTEVATRGSTTRFLVCGPAKDAG